VSSGTLYWHDYETFGTDPFWDRPAQFAGIRTTEDLETVGDPLTLYCKPANDMLPHPEACLITGITPQLALQKGISEAEFISKIHDQLAVPNTCGVGYNSIRFDDEITRNCLYRNFFDPYAREWQHGNSRWDILDMLRLAHALRPKGIEWPQNEAGLPSFRLEDMARANGIEHAGAHDALADVRATIGVARLVRDRLPKLYSYVFGLRRKRKLMPLLVFGNAQPLLHVSGRYPASEGCIAVILPVARDPGNSNGIIVYNLSKDPQFLFELDVEALRRRLFRPGPEGSVDQEKIALKTVHVNKCPVLVPLKTMREQDAERLGIDLELCFRNLAAIRQQESLGEKVARVFADPPRTETTDPDLMIYSGGFFGELDKASMTWIRNANPADLTGVKRQFEDSRISEMLFRYRARNFHASLSDTEKERWETFRLQRIRQGEEGRGLGLASYRSLIEDLRGDPDCSPERGAILDQLEAWSDRIMMDCSAP
jgi:exodeoxyribonuclease-1